PTVSALADKSTLPLSTIIKSDAPAPFTSTAYVLGKEATLPTRTVPIELPGLSKPPAPVNCPVITKLPPRRAPSLMAVLPTICTGAPDEPPDTLEPCVRTTSPWIVVGAV